MGSGTVGDEAAVSSTPHFDLAMSSGFPAPVHLSSP
jgi:hypothetical protein